MSPPIVKATPMMSKVNDWENLGLEWLEPLNWTNLCSAPRCLIFREIPGTGLVEPSSELERKDTVFILSCSAPFLIFYEKQDSSDGSVTFFLFFSIQGTLFPAVLPVAMDNLLLLIHKCCTPVCSIIRVLFGTLLVSPSFIIEWEDTGLVSCSSASCSAMISSKYE